MRPFKIVLAVISLFIIAQTAIAQPVTALQYRHVPQENIQEFIERETTYWQKVAQKAIDEGKLGFWGLFQKVSVYDAPNTSNFVFVNTIPNLDAEGTWNPSAVFPDVPMEDMETMSLSTVTSQIYISPEHWVDGENATPEQDYNYIVFNYFDPEDPEAWIEMEATTFKPWITEAMKSEGTSQNAWGNAYILAPLGGGMNATTMSMDMFPSLHSALRPKVDTEAELDVDAVSAQWEQLKTPHHKVIYRIIAVATADED